MSKAKYKIIEFKDNTMSIVPETWLYHGGTKCYWPTVKGQLKINKMIIDMVYPDFETWISWDVIKLWGTTSEYKEALDKLKLLENSSDADDIVKNAEMYKSTRQKRAKKNIGEISEDSRDEDESPKGKNEKKTKKKDNKNYSPRKKPEDKKNRKKSTHNDDYSGTDSLDEEYHIEKPPSFTENSLSTTDGNSKELNDVDSPKTGGKKKVKLPYNNDDTETEGETPSSQNTPRKTRNEISKSGCQGKQATATPSSEKSSNRNGNIQTEGPIDVSTPHRGYQEAAKTPSRVIIREEAIQKSYEKSIDKIEKQVSESEATLNEAYLKEIIYLLNKQSIDIDELKRQLNKSSHKLQSNKKISFSWSGILPFNDIHTFEEYSTKIDKDPELEESLIELLKTLGGRDDRSKTNAIMEKMMSDDLGARYSWKGQKGKAKLQELKIANVILGTIIKVTTEEFTESLAKLQIGNWLAGRKSKINRVDKEKAAGKT